MISHDNDTGIIIMSDSRTFSVFCVWIQHDRNIILDKWKDYKLKTIRGRKKNWWESLVQRAYNRRATVAKGYLTLTSSCNMTGPPFADVRPTFLPSTVSSLHLLRFWENANQRKKTTSALFCFLRKWLVDLWRRMSHWWSLCTLYLSHAGWSYRRRLGSPLLCGLFNRWRQLFERNYFPLFVADWLKA